jgi:hypothetical protein
MKEGLFYLEEYTAGFSLKLVLFVTLSCAGVY